MTHEEDGYKVDDIMQDFCINKIASLVENKNHNNIKKL